MLAALRESLSQKSVTAGLGPKGQSFARQVQKERGAVAFAHAMRICGALAILLCGTMAITGSSAADDLVPAATCTPRQALRAPLGDASIAGFVPTPLAKKVTSLTLETGSAVRSGQTLVAAIMTYGGALPTIAVPDGWRLIREDISPSTRQSIYWHIAQSNDEVSEWKFSQAVDAQAVVVMLDDASASDLVDASSGIAGSQEVKAPTLTTADDGDLILAFFATDFGGTAPGPHCPDTMVEVMDQTWDSHPYWIVGAYQPQRGDLDQVDCPTPQLYNAAAAQVALRRR